MNNAVFGKTMENVRGRVDIKIAFDDEYQMKYMSKPYFKSLTNIKNDDKEMENENMDVDDSTQSDDENSMQESKVGTKNNEDESSINKRKLEDIWNDATEEAIHIPNKGLLSDLKDESTSTNEALSFCNQRYNSRRKRARDYNY